MADLDLLDRRIMHELDLDARLSASQLARKLRKSKETVNFRLNRLLKEGFIKGFYTIFSTSKLGWYYHKLYLKFKDATPQKEREIVEYLKSQPHIAFLASLEGYYDCICLVMVRSSKEMAAFLYPFMKLYGDFVQQKDMAVFLTTHRLNQKFLYEGTERKDWHYPVEIGNYETDAIDRKIVDALSTNSRLPLVKLAEKAGVDANVANYRLKKLQKDGIILAYVTAPNFDKLGLQFVQVNISFRDPTLIKQAIAYFDSTNRCLYAMEMIGKYDLAVELHIENSRQLNAIMDGFREKFVNKFDDYDISTIIKEHLVVWSPFSGYEGGK